MRPRDIYAIFILTLLFVVAATGPVLYAQVADAIGVPAPPAPADANEWGGALVWAFFSSSALEWLKRNRQISLITEQTAFFAQRVIGILLALAAAVGVHWSFDADAGRLVVEGLQWTSIWALGTGAIRQWVLQELTYRTAVKPYRPVVTSAGAV